MASNRKSVTAVGAGNGSFINYGRHARLVIAHARHLAPEMVIFDHPPAPRGRGIEDGGAPDAGAKGGHPQRRAETFQHFGEYVSVKIRLRHREAHLGRALRNCTTER
jgi:hypothetical protein